MTNLRQALLLTAVCGAFAMSAGAAQADPLGGKEPWNFQPQNRAGIAATIKAIEDNGNGGGSGGGTTIVCGGTSGASGDGGTGSGASSTANSTCIIVNNSDGSVIDVDQDSDGNQSSDANAESQSSQGPSGSIDEVAAILAGKAQ